MKVAITGYTGKIGKKLLSELLRIKDCEIVCLGRNQPVEFYEKRLSWYYWDASKFNKTSTKVIADILIICHGINIGTLSKQVSVNAFSIQELSKIIVNKEAVKTIYLSSRLVYKGSEDDFIDVGYDLCPLSPYAKSKYAGECILKAEFLRSIVLRVPSVYDENNLKTNMLRINDSMGLLGLFMTQISRDKQISIYEDADFVRGFISVSNLVNAVIMMIFKKNFYSAILNSPFEHNFSTHLLAKALASFYGVPLKMVGSMPKSLAKYETGNMYWSDKSFKNLYPAFSNFDSPLDNIIL